MTGFGWLVALSISNPANKRKLRWSSRRLGFVSHVFPEIY